jgi:hypothetical protein
MPRSSSECPTSALGPRCVKAEKPGIFKDSATCPDVRKSCSDRSESSNFLYFFTQPGPKRKFVAVGGTTQQESMDLSISPPVIGVTFRTPHVSREATAGLGPEMHRGGRPSPGRDLYEVPLTYASSAMFSCVAPWDTVLFCFPFATQGFAACSAVR